MKSQKFFLRRHSEMTSTTKQKLYPCMRKVYENPKAASHCVKANENLSEHAYDAPLHT